MKALIIEDENLIAAEMRDTIARLAPDVEVLDILPSLKASRKWFMSNAEPDLLFLDIKLSDGLSFELFDQFALQCPVIFCTAYEEYAVRAFRVNGVDYLLKPVQEEELQKAIEKVRNMRESKSFIKGDLQQLLNYFNDPQAAKKQFKERFIINANNKWTPVETRDIALFYKD